MKSPKIGFSHFTWKVGRKNTQGFPLFSQRLQCFCTLRKMSPKNTALAEKREANPETLTNLVRKSLPKRLTRFGTVAVWLLSLAALLHGVPRKKRSSRRKGPQTPRIFYPSRPQLKTPEKQRNQLKNPPNTKELPCLENTKENENTKEWKIRERPRPPPPTPKFPVDTPGPSPPLLLEDKRGTT